MRKRQVHESLVLLFTVSAISVACAGGLPNDEDVDAEADDSESVNAPEGNTGEEDQDETSSLEQDETDQSESDGSSATDEGSPYLADALDEGEVTWYAAHYSLETHEYIVELFEEQYPDITVNLHRQTAQRIYQRFSQEAEAGQTNSDLISLTTESLMHTMAEEGQLSEFAPSADYRDDVSEYNHDESLYHVAGISSNIIAYNTEMVTDEEAPRTWDELLDDKWDGQIATGHPGASGTVGVWATHMNLNKDGYLEELADQDILIGQSIQDTMPRVASGERALGVSHDQSTALNIEKGDPMAIIYPEDGAVATPAFSAVPSGAPNPNAARLLADFILSEDVQKSVGDEFMLAPVIKGIEPPDYIPDDVSYVRPTRDELLANLEETITKWRELFGV